MKKLMVLTLASMMAFSTVGCSSQDASAKETKALTETITIGVMGSVDAIPLVIAQEKGYFEEAGVEVQVEVFKAAKDRDAALQADALDGVLADQVAIAIYQNAGIDMKITGITDGQFGLVAGANSGIASIEDIKGKKIGISENTVIEYTLDKILEDNGMTPDDVEKVVIPPMPNRLEMVNSGQIDAAIMPNPFSDAAEAAGGKTIEKIDNTGRYISVTAFKQDVIDTKEAELKAFYSAYDKAVEYLNTTDISEYEDTIITVVGYPEDMRGNIIMPTFRKNQLPESAQIEEVLTWSTHKGLLTKELKSEDVVYEIIAD